MELVNERKSGLERANVDLTPESFSKPKDGKELLYYEGKVIVESPSGSSLCEINLPEKFELQITTQSVILWSFHLEKGIQIEYSIIILHALSLSNHHIYLQVEDPSKTGETIELILQMNESNEIDNELDIIYKALSFCSSLHPGPTKENEPEFLQDSAVFDVGDIAGSDGWVTADSLKESLTSDGKKRRVEE